MSERYPIILSTGYGPGEYFDWVNKHPGAKVSASFIEGGSKVIIDLLRSEIKTGLTFDQRARRSQLQAEWSARGIDLFFDATSIISFVDKRGTPGFPPSEIPRPREVIDQIYASGTDYGFIKPITPPADLPVTSLVPGIVNPTVNSPRIRITEIQANNLAESLVTDSTGKYADPARAEQARLELGRLFGVPGAPLDAKGAPIPQKAAEAAKVAVVVDTVTDSPAQRHGASTPPDKPDLPLPGKDNWSTTPRDKAVAPDEKPNVPVDAPNTSVGEVDMKSAYDAPNPQAGTDPVSHQAAYPQADLASLGPLVLLGLLFMA